MIKLVISDDEGKTTVVPLVRDEITIGRKEGNTIRLTERNVSRRHARLRREDSTFLIEDLGSYNGIRVNGQRITKETPLKVGDQIGVGDYILTLQVDQTQPVATSNETTAQLSEPIETPDATTAVIAAPAGIQLPPRLVMLSLPTPGAEFAVSQERTRIGRAENLDIPILHRSISREHAEVYREGDQFRIADLGSANGLRVNGKDFDDAALRSGDIVELGKVRLRFVGPGEPYEFDADRTIQVDASAADFLRPRRSATFLGLAAVAVTGVVVMYIARPDLASRLLGRGETLRATEGSDAAFRNAISECEAALKQAQFRTALGKAEIALRDRPSDSAAQSCRSRAEAGLSEEMLFLKGKLALEAGNWSEAQRLFDGLPESSVFKERQEVKTAEEQRLRSLLARAERTLPVAPSEAEGIASAALQSSHMAEDIRSAFERVRDAARSRRPPSVLPPEKRPTPQHAAHSRGESHPNPQPTREVPDTPPPPRVSALEEARDCLAQGDQLCAVRVLEGRANTAQELALLIETYRSMGSTGAALRKMADFVRKYPTAPRADDYRAFLERHGR